MHLKAPGIAAPPTKIQGLLFALVRARQRERGARSRQGQEQAGGRREKREGSASPKLIGPDRLGNPEDKARSLRAGEERLVALERLLNRTEKAHRRIVVPKEEPGRGA